MKTVAAVSAGIAAGCWGYSGCLAKEHVVADLPDGGDAAVDLRPLNAPVILEDPTITTPLPGTVVFLHEGDTAHFSLALVTDDPEPLTAVAWYDRKRPCSDLAGNCGVSILNAPLPAGDSGSVRPLSFTFTPLAAGHCYVVDLYVAPAFMLSPSHSTDHLPVRAGDVAHARWMVVTYVSSPGTTLPDSASCLVGVN